MESVRTYTVRLPIIKAWTGIVFTYTDCRFFQSLQFNQFRHMSSLKNTLEVFMVSEGRMFHDISWFDFFHLFGETVLTCQNVVVSRLFCNPAFLWISVLHYFRPPNGSCYSTSDNFILPYILQAMDVSFVRQYIQIYVSFKLTSFHFFLRMSTPFIVCWKTSGVVLIGTSYLSVKLESTK